MNPQSLDVRGTHQLWTISRDMKSTRRFQGDQSHGSSCVLPKRDVESNGKFPPKKIRDTQKDLDFWGKHHEYAIYTILENTHFHGHFFWGLNLELQTFSSLMPAAMVPVLGIYTEGPRFPSMGVTPIVDGWFQGKSRNGWWTGVPLF